MPLFRFAAFDPTTNKNKMAPGGFLCPTIEERAALKTKHEDAVRKKKAENKLKAEQRKRKREEDAERVERIECNRPKAIEDRSIAKIDAFLKSPPYFGRSNIEHKDRIKELCGDGHRSWDRERKLWGTLLVENLENLIKSGKWTPFGIEESWLPSFVEAVRERVAQQQQQQLQQQQKQQQKLDQAKEAHSNAVQKSQKARVRELDDLVIPAVDEEVDECKRLGLVEKTISSSRYWPELGPRSGNSDEGRLLRWVQIVKTDLIYEFEREPEVFWNSDRLRVHLDARMTKLVAECNARA